MREGWARLRGKYIFVSSEGFAWDQEMALERVGANRERAGPSCVVSRVNAFEGSVQYPVVERPAVEHRAGAPERVALPATRSDSQILADWVAGFEHSGAVLRLAPDPECP